MLNYCFILLFLSTGAMMVRWSATISWVSALMWSCPLSTPPSQQAVMIIHMSGWVRMLVDNDKLNSLLTLYKATCHANHHLGRFATVLLLLFFFFLPRWRLVPNILGLQLWEMCVVAESNLLQWVKYICIKYMFLFVCLFFFIFLFVCIHVYIFYLFSIYLFVWILFYLFIHVFI